MTSKISKYNPDILSIFEIIGSYFVNQFYTSLHVAAKHKFINADKDKRGLTDIYKSLIVSYMSGITSDRRYYAKTCLGLQRYFQDHTKYKTISLHEFIDKIVSKILPPEYFENLSENEKEFFLYNFIMNIVKDFGIEVLRVKNLKMAVDSRSKRNADIWKEIIVNIQILKREEVFSKFVKKVTNKSDMIPSHLVDSLKANFTDVLKEKCLFESNFKKSLMVIKKISSELDVAKDNNKLLETSNKEYLDDIDNLQKQLLNTKIELNRLKTNKVISFESDHEELTISKPIKHDRLYDDIMLLTNPNNVSSDADNIISSDANNKISSDADNKISSDADNKISSDADNKISDDIDNKISDDVDNKISDDVEYVSNQENDTMLDDSVLNDIKDTISDTGVATIEDEDVDVYGGMISGADMTGDSNFDFELGSL